MNVYNINSEHLEQVNLIASGYEWTCPKCEILHTEIEVTKTVYCFRCKKYYEVGEVHHAYE